MSFFFIFILLFSLNGFSATDRDIQDLNRSFAVVPLSDSLDKIKNLLTDGDLSLELGRLLLRTLRRADHIISGSPQSSQALHQSLEDCYVLAAEKGFLNQRPLARPRSLEDLYEASTPDLSFLVQLETRIKQVDIQQMSDTPLNLFFEMDQANQAVIATKMSLWEAVKRALSEGITSFQSRDFSEAHRHFKEARVAYGQCIPRVWSIRESRPNLHRKQAHWIFYLESLSAAYVAREARDQAMLSQSLLFANTTLQTLLELSKEGIDGSEMKLSGSSFDRMIGSLQPGNPEFLPLRPTLPPAFMPFQTSLIDRIRTRLPFCPQFSERFEMALKCLQHGDYQEARKHFVSLQNLALQTAGMGEFATAFQYYILLTECAYLARFGRDLEPIHEKIVECVEFVHYHEQGRRILNADRSLQEHKWVVELESYFRPTI